jgi:hypothetical protein
MTAVMAVEKADAAELRRNQRAALTLTPLLCNTSHSSTVDMN